MKTKKNKLVNFLKTGILLFGISFLLWNCEKDETNFHTELAIPEPLAKKITIDQFQKENNTSTIFSDIYENLDIKKAYHAKGSKNKDKIVVLTDKILKVEKNNVTTYAFGLEKPTSESSDFENLMIFKYADNTHKFIILKYQYTGNEEKPYKIKYWETNADELRNFDQIEQFLAKAGEDLNLDDCVKVSHWCPSGGTNYHGPEVCGSGTGTTETTLDFSNCFNMGTGGNGGPVDSGDSDIGDNDNTDGNSGGSGTNSGGTGAVNTPTEPSDLTIIAKKIAGILGLNSTERSWLNRQDETTVLSIESILDENNSVESKAFAKALITARINDNYDDFFNLEIFTQDPYNVWKNLSQDEKALTSLYPYFAYKIWKNRKPAEDATRLKFGGNFRNDKSDAFRHAFYNALNAQGINKEIVRLFSNAHESEVPQSEIIEKEMDLFNNGIGIKFGNDNENLDYNQLIDAIYQKIIGGELKYIKNGVLIFTNN